MRIHQMRGITVRILGLLPFFVLINACSPTPSTPVPPQISISAVTEIPLTATAIPSTAKQVEVTSAPLPMEDTLPSEIGLDPANWMAWPEVPIVTQQMRDVYLLGQSLGNDPHAFSILGDCQSTPETFLGLYEDLTELAALPVDLQETAFYFSDSLSRLSPTAKSGTTSGALLWVEWHEGKYSCSNTKTPLDCELRLNKPSFALVTVGTHWEARNERYMRKIIEQLLAQGVVPILSTKADNREGDHGINAETALLAAEYGLPLWNYWPVTEDLPNRGLYTKKGNEFLGDIYLTDEALDLHRYSALQALDAVWRAVTGEQ